MAARSGGLNEREREKRAGPNVAALRRALYRDAIVILEFDIMEIRPCGIVKGVVYD